MSGREIDIAAFAEALDAGATVIDVRTPEEFAWAHVPGAKLLPLDELAARADEVPKGVRVYIICAVGGRSLSAANALADAGWDAVSVMGGTNRWVEEGRPFVTGLDG